MRIRSPFLIKVVSYLITLFLRSLHKTCRHTFIEKGTAQHPYQDTGDSHFFYCVWHENTLMGIFIRNMQKSSALTSMHRDGSYIANFLKFTGVKPIRGSSSRGGAVATRKILEAVKDLHVVITPDGPRGPAKKLKPGVLFLASHSGRTIVPAAFMCRSCWRIKAKWGDVVIPKPFTEIVCIAGEPVEIPPNINDEQMEYYTAMVTQQMIDLEAEATARAKHLPLPQTTTQTATTEIASDKKAA